MMDDDLNVSGEQFDALRARLEVEIDTKNRIWRDFQVADEVAKVRWDEMQRQRARAEAAERQVLVSTADSKKSREYADMLAEKAKGLLVENGQLVLTMSAAKSEVARLNRALAMIDEARAKAVSEIEAVHQYLDECFINAPDEGRAVPLIDRVVLLVSRWAKADGEVTRLNTALRALQQAQYDTQVDEMCSVCGRSAVLLETVTLCENCYEDRIA